ncbi:MAG: arylsulfatase [Planctomycetaceae bacterium]|nr:arylsulfatase [Planctomycetaceae bacterium]
MCQLTLLLILTSGHCVRAADTPNIIIVMVDDMGYSDLGYFGSAIETPVLDNLASHGVTFSNFYNTARCWSTRASLMTGFYPQQVNKAMSFGPKAPFGYQGNIPRETKFLSELLQTHGYSTYHVGKWHLNNRTIDIENSWPLGRGFDKSYCVVSQNNFFAPWRMRDENQTIIRSENSRRWPKDYYMTTAIGERSRIYLQDHLRNTPEKPFFLYVAHTAPHFPLQAPHNVTSKYLGKYMHGWDEERKRRQAILQEKGIVVTGLPERDQEAVEWVTLSRGDQIEWDSRMAVHSAMIDVVDQEVGRLIALLSDWGVYEDTVIFFLSDNGASAEVLVRGDGDDPTVAPGSIASYECLEVGWSNACNTPFREHKMWTHEGGISTPLIVHWPNGNIGSGKITRQNGHVIDLVPTIMDIVNSSLPVAVEYPGKSLLGTIRSGKTHRRTLFWEHLGNRAVRRGQWKAVSEYQHAWQLFDMRTDRGENIELSEYHPALLKQLISKWDDWAEASSVVHWETMRGFHPNYPFEYKRK